MSAALLSRIWGRLWLNSLAQNVAYLTKRFSPPHTVPRIEIDRAELARLQALPRFEHTVTQLFGRPVRIIDAHSYLEMAEEIFGRENYRFASRRADPLIVDCGSNIGLSVIFFKHLYPGARILAFEPDPQAFEALRTNVTEHGFTGVELINKAVSVRQGKMFFLAEGSWGGRLSENGQTEVATVRLRDFLGGPVDFLKIDIEGAEADVLTDCADLLPNVEHLFFEYHSEAGARQRLHEILAVVQQAGMRYHLKEAAVRPHPYLTAATVGFDSQLDVFASRRP